MLYMIDWQTSTCISGKWHSLSSGFVLSRTTLFNYTECVLFINKCSHHKSYMYSSANIASPFIHKQEVRRLIMGIDIPFVLSLLCRPVYINLTQKSLHSALYRSMLVLKVHVYIRAELSTCNQSRSYAISMPSIRYMLETLVALFSRYFEGEMFLHWILFYKDVDMKCFGYCTVRFCENT